MVHQAFDVAASHLENTASVLPATSYPVRSGADGSWVTSDAAGWTSGFFPGSLWLMYERTGERRWQDLAERWQSGLTSQQYNTSTHDVGFMIFDSFGNDLRLTADPEATQVVRTAAGSLARRFNPAVGSIRSWGGLGSSGFTVIIDNMMNLELLFWAAENGGDPSFREMAISHALNARRDLVRSDGSTFHVAEYDPTSGRLISQHTNQGYADNSTWSRGQAWAVHGFSMAYRATSDQRFLDTARQVADYYIDHLPADRVPYWDFTLTGRTGEPRDSSAAAIAASGLLDLSSLEPDADRADRYRDIAGETLAALSGPSYLASDTAQGAVLRHGTQNKPGGSADTGLVFGDYYYLEALLRYVQVTGNGC